MPDFKLANGCTFRCMLEPSDTTPEIYGWVEDRHGLIIKGHGGWYRTPDAAAAARIAASNLNTTIEEA